MHTGVVMKSASPCAILAFQPPNPSVTFPKVHSLGTLTNTDSKKHYLPVADSTLIAGFPYLEQQNITDVERIHARNRPIVAYFIIYLVLMVPSIEYAV